MKLLVTGSGGFVGNFLVKHFSEKGIRVVGLDLRKLSFQDYKNFSFIRCDIRDKGLVEDIVRNEKPTHIIHLAFLMKPQHNKRFEYDVDVNGSKNIFDAARKSGSVKQFINFSSASIYGGWKDNPLWIEEDYPRRPRKWVYAQNKLIVEDYYFRARKNFKLVNFRMCTACGPSYFRNDGLVDILAKAPVWLKLDGKDTLMQFIHEDDVKNIVELVIKDSRIEGIFNLASDSYASAREMCINAKLSIPLPKILFSAIVSVLWHLRLSPVSPTSVDLTAHSIIISPEKIMKRLRYKFRYSTKEAFFDEYNKRKKAGSI